MNEQYEKGLGRGLGRIRGKGRALKRDDGNGSTVFVVPGQRIAGVIKGDFYESPWKGKNKNRIYRIYRINLKPIRCIQVGVKCVGVISG
jgi:hypothetical protein